MIPLLLGTVRRVKEDPALILFTSGETLTFSERTNFFLSLFGRPGFLG